jgi:3-hydroxyisobutyrate dehydrogenase
MALSLLRAGFSVRGYDINPSAVQALVAAGGQAADSVAAAAQGVDVLVLMVLNGDQAETVLFGAEGAAGVLPPGSLVMICCTVSPAFVRSVAERLDARQIGLLDAPVSGGTARAAEGKLSIMASGAPAAFAGAQPLLDALAENVYTMGDTPGQGATMKLINQELAGIHIAAAAEAIALGARAGIDPQRIYEVISNSAGASWMFQNRVPHILADDYTPRSAVEIWLKDLGLVLDTGKELRLPLPLAAVAQQLFIMAAAAGHARLDDSAVVKVYEQLAGFRVVDTPGAAESRESR